MRIYGKQWLKFSVAEDLKRKSLKGFWYGTEPPDHLEQFKGFHVPTGTQLIYTRDIGMHTAGWLKNPDYERCLHLSLSFWYVPGDVLMPSGSHVEMYPVPRDVKLSKEWVDLFFGESKRYLWAESPKSDYGRKMEIWHYRVFCDEAWQPIVPRKEVYSREFTEAGWQSFSEIKELQDSIVPSDTQ